MKTIPRTILSVTVISLYGFAFVGCKNDSSSTTAATSGVPFSLNEQDDDDHDDGTPSIQMVVLSNDSKTKVVFDGETENFTVYIDGLGEVSKVQMTTTISDKETVYEFERQNIYTGYAYILSSPELAAAVKMGKDVVQTVLTITTSDGEVTGQFEHHPH